MPSVPMAPSAASLAQASGSDRESLRARLMNIAELAQLDDSRLVAALVCGRAGATDVLVSRYADVVRRVLLHTTRSASDIEDLSQDVFLRAHRRIGSLNSGEKLKAWLIAIAAFVARESRRSQQRRGWLSFVEPWSLLELPVEAREETSSSAAATRAIVAALPVEEQAALSLRFVEGARLHEIMLELGVSISTAKRRVDRAKHHFRTQALRHRDLTALLRWHQ